MPGVKVGALIESTDIFSDLCSPAQLHRTHGFIKCYKLVNVKFFEHPQCFSFQIIVAFYAILHVFVFCSHFGCSISNEKLNGHQVFESLGILGAVTFLFKQHISE